MRLGAKGASMCLAIVLIGAFLLLVPVPVARAHGSNDPVVGGTLTNDCAPGTGSIAWSKERAHSGSNSVKMILPKNPGTNYGLNIRDIVGWNMAICNIASIYFWVYPTYPSTCYPEDEQGPFLMLYIDRDGDGTVDVYLIATDTNTSPDAAPNSIVQNAWNKVTWFQGWHSWVVPEYKYWPLEGSPPPQRTGSWTEWHTYYVSQYPNHKVVTFRIGWGYEDNTAQERTAYVDDLVINNIVYNLEPTVTGAQSKPCPAGETTTVGSSTAGVSADVTTSTGTPTVTVSTYRSNPGAVTFSAFGKYVDLLISSADGVTEIVIKVYYTDAQVAAAGLVESLLKLCWWNGRSWVACSDSGVNTLDNYIWAKIRADTVPNLSQLIGSPFGSSWDD